MSRAKELLEAKEIKRIGEEEGRKVSIHQRNDKMKIISKITDIQSNIDELEGQLRNDEEKLKKLSDSISNNESEGEPLSEWDIDQEDIDKIVNLFDNAINEKRKGKVEKGLLAFRNSFKHEEILKILDKINYDRNFFGEDRYLYRTMEDSIDNNIQQHLKNLMSDYIDDILKKLNNWKNIPEKYIKLVGNEKEKEIFKTQKIHVPRDQETKNNIGITFGLPSLKNLEARAQSQESDNSRSRSSSEVSSIKDEYSPEELFELSKDQLEDVEKAEKEKFKELDMYNHQINELKRSIKSLYSFVYMLCVYCYYYSFTSKNCKTIRSYYENPEALKYAYITKRITSLKDMQIFWTIYDILGRKITEIIENTFNDYEYNEKDELIKIEENQGKNLNTITINRKLELLNSLLNININKFQYNGYGDIFIGISSASEYLTNPKEYINIPNFVTNISKKEPAFECESTRERERDKDIISNDNLEIILKKLLEFEKWNVEELERKRARGKERESIRDLARNRRERGRSRSRERSRSRSRERKKEEKGGNKTKKNKTQKKIVKKKLKKTIKLKKKSNH